MDWWTIVGHASVLLVAIYGTTVPAVIVWSVVESRRLAPRHPPKGDDRHGQNAARPSRPSAS